MSVLTERYRPKSLDEVVGQELAVARLNLIRRKFGWEGQCFFLSGPSGSGKTTLARIIAETVARPIAIDEVDGQDLSMEVIRDWERRCGFKPMGGGIWGLIVNECHGMSGKVVSRLQTVLEQEQLLRSGGRVRGQFPADAPAGLLRGHVDRLGNILPQAGPEATEILAGATASAGMRRRAARAALQDEVATRR